MINQSKEMLYRWMIEMAKNIEKGSSIIYRDNFKNRIDQEAKRCKEIDDFFNAK